MNQYREQILNVTGLRYFLPAELIHLPHYFIGIIYAGSVWNRWRFNICIPWQYVRGLQVVASQSPLHTTPSVSVAGLL